MHVLATLFLLSYTKILRTIIFGLGVTFLHETNGQIAVWSFDGTVDYFSPKHIVLFLACLATLLVLWLPYTFMLLFGQWLQKVCNYKSSVHKLKPLFDAYFGPLKDKRRYWVGFLLLVRGGLSLVFAVSNSSNVNMLAIVATLLVVLVYLANVGLVYRQKYLSWIENTCFLNLLLFATGTLYNHSTNGKQAALAYTSVAIVLVQFLVVLIFHALLLSSNQHFGQIWKEDTKFWQDTYDKETMTMNLLKDDSNMKECQRRRERID